MLKYKKNNLEQSESIFTIIDYILNHSNETNATKILEIAYLAHALYLTTFDRPLIAEPFMIYDMYVKHEKYNKVIADKLPSGFITDNNFFIDYKKDLNFDQKDTIDDIIKDFGNQKNIHVADYLVTDQGYWDLNDYDIIPLKLTHQNFTNHWYDKNILNDFEEYYKDFLDESFFKVTSLDNKINNCKIEFNDTINNINYKIRVNNLISLGRSNLDLRLDVGIDTDFKYYPIFQTTDSKFIDYIRNCNEDIKDETIYHTILIENDTAVDIISLDQPKITQIYCKNVTFMV